MEGKKVTPGRDRIMLKVQSVTKLRPLRDAHK